MEVKRLLGSLAKVERDAAVIAQGGKPELISKRPPSLNPLRNKRPISNSKPLSSIKEKAISSQASILKSIPDKIRDDRRVQAPSQKSTTQLEQIVQERETIACQKKTINAISLLHYLSALFAVRKKRHLRVFIENIRQVIFIKTAVNDRLKGMVRVLTKYQKYASFQFLRSAVESLPVKARAHGSNQLNDQISHQDDKEIPSLYFLELANSFRQFNLLAKSFSSLRVATEQARTLKESLQNKILRQKVQKFSQAISKLSSAKNIDEEESEPTPEQIKQAKEKKVLKRLKEIEERRAKARKRMNEIKMQHERRRQEKAKDAEALQVFLKQEKTKMREDEIAARKEKAAFDKRQKELKAQRKIAEEEKLARALAFRKKWQMKSLLRILTRNLKRVVSIGDSIRLKSEISLKAGCMKAITSSFTLLQAKQRKLIYRANDFNRKIRCNFILKLLKMNLKAKYLEEMKEANKLRLGFVFRNWQRRLTHLKVKNYERSKMIEEKRRQAIRYRCFHLIKDFCDEQRKQKMQVQMKEVTKEELKQKAAAWLSEFRARRG